MENEVCPLIDREVVVKEVDDLIATQQDSCTKRQAYKDALLKKERIEAEGKARLDALVLEVNAANEAAAIELSQAEVASLVADELNTRQMSYMCDLIKSIPGVDPTV